ncbi:uncharacterized protein A1O9_07003 [Exophiala aquamarina CBS 119918]|uniref:Metallo-beta-lactamase domain-containing protein n=1 Tax=Exophiala aquamarina CBS 119918 TaxID=1182545 RepID=A0A072PC15_9EURO|nr:uncharacterized protein A1O9_07003 [Exophiala aquamarina CBS 119918]KEF56813.1 hypothetical protein A1O9_07003 [Exophiala aquamarina CBS 119918]
MTTHCHYDHILGISKLPPTAAAAAGIQRAPIPIYSRNYCERKKAPPPPLPPPPLPPPPLPPPPPTTVLTSSRGKAFVTPYSNLQKHSLAGTLGLCAPKYDVGIWAEDYSQVVYDRSPSPTIPQPDSQIPSPLAMTIQIRTPYTILHTPGHTPDSLSWYDAENRVLCVGDSFYLKETPFSNGAPWGPEPPMPTMFDKESDLADWWRSLHKVLDFVVIKNWELGKELEDRIRESNSTIPGSSLTSTTTISTTPTHAST